MGEMRDMLCEKNCTIQMIFAHCTHMYVYEWMYDMHGCMICIYIYIFVSLYHLDLERYSGISRDTTLYQNPPILNVSSSVNVGHSF